MYCFARGRHAHLPEFWDDPGLKYVPVAWRNTWTPEEHKWYSHFPTDDPERLQARMRGFYDSLLPILKRMHEAGVPIMAGTDASNWNFLVPGQSLIEELEIFVDIGMTPLEALRTATVAPINFLNLLDRAGSVEPGKRADLVLLDENPLENIGNLRSIRAVLIGGKPFDRAYLDALLDDLERRSNQASP